MTSSPRRTTAWMASKIASVAPLVIVMSVPGSTATPYMSLSLLAIAVRSATEPGIGAYWWKRPSRHLSTSSMSASAPSGRVAVAVAPAAAGPSGRAALTSDAQLA